MPTQLMSKSLHGDPMTAQITGLGSTSPTSVTEFVLYYSPAPARLTYTSTAYNLHTIETLPNWGAYNYQGENILASPQATTTAIAEAGFSHAANNSVPYLGLNGTADAGGLTPGALIIGEKYSVVITDANGKNHVTPRVRLMALYKSTGDTTVNAGTGPIALINSIGTSNLLTESDSLTANMIVAEFNFNIWNNEVGVSVNHGLGDKLTAKFITTASDIIQAPGIGQSDCTSFHNNINVYSFALKPEEHQPSGTCNFSRIDNAQLIFDTAPESNTHIYAVNYNVLRIMSGMGGLAYSN